MSVVEAMLWGIAGSLVTFFSLSLLFYLPGSAQRQIKDHARQLHQFTLDYSWPVLIALCAIAGVGEELLFRGALQNWLGGMLPDWSALIIAAVAFGLVHFLSWLYFLVATALGLILGGVYMLTDSLWLVMVWHAVYDLVAVICLRRMPHLFGIQRSN